MITDEMVEAAITAHAQAKWKGGLVQDNWRAALEAALAAAPTPKAENRPVEQEWIERSKANAELYARAENEFFANVTMPEGCDIQPFKPHVWVNEEFGIAQMILEDCSTITGQPMIVRPLKRAHAPPEKRDIVGFEWDVPTPKAEGDR